MADALVLPVQFVPSRTAVYTATRDARGIVFCRVWGDVSRGGEPRDLPNVAYHVLAGFGMGLQLSSASDLALSILLDYLGVDVGVARESLRNGFRTDDVRLLRAWMAHQRLREQRVGLGESSAGFTVSAWELSRLLREGFLTEEDEERSARWVRGRERKSNAVRVSRAGGHKKPGEEKR